MAQEAARGSAKLWDRVFDIDPPTQGALGEAVAGARETYTIKRWWKYGQPAIDRIKATLDVATTESGPLVQEILNSAGPGRSNIILEAFPYGLPKLDRVQLDVIFEREVNR
jgi:hypothetical protein